MVLYELAFRHKSASIRGRDGVLLNNERLEFLGDAVLNVLVTDLLFTHFECEGEGFLTNTRSKIVQRETLNNIALVLGLDKWVLKAEYASSPRQSIFGTSLEAIIGAVYLDRGYRSCKRFLKKKIIQRFIDIEHIANQEINFKSKIIEWCQHQKVELNFYGSELIRQNAPQVFALAETVADEWVNDGRFEALPVGHPLAQALAAYGLRKAKNVEKKLDEKGVFAIVKMGIDYAQSKIRRP